MSLRILHSRITDFSFFGYTSSSAWSEFKVFLDVKAAHPGLSASSRCEFIAVYIDCLLCFKYSMELCRSGAYENTKHDPNQLHCLEVVIVHTRFKENRVKAECQMNIINCPAASLQRCKR